MRILRHTSNAPPEVLGSVITLGNFDGVHHGHRAVLEEAKRQAKTLSTACGVLTFEPHPRSFFFPDAPPFRLTSLRDKAHAIESLGIDFLIVQHFDAAFAAWSAETFVRRALVEDLQVAHVVTGYDFRFGKGRKGDAEMLKTLAGQFGFTYTAVSPVTAKEEPYSSTKIRTLLQNGEPAKAAAMLGHYWEIEGRVEAGSGLGHELGFPTANIALGDHLQPKLGIYAVRAGIDEGAETVWRDGAGYFGTRPTFSGAGLFFEVYFFDGNPDLYGKHLRVRLIGYLREDTTFEDAETLQHQMTEDVARAREVLAKAGDPA
ncbi:MAG: bifunctional riboflavin kinase/FAD synthetase [Alphaproteobacteria bacterium]|nr:bifunctional riboflavin kinase/FAD synthetase [Alphaproteobacteria bacterium]